MEVAGDGSYRLYRNEDPEDFDQSVMHILITGHYAGDGNRAFAGSELCWLHDVRHRVVISWASNGNVTLFHDGEQVGNAVATGFAMMTGATNLMWICQVQATPQSVSTYGRFGGVLHEFGYLDGYAATAEDVATNPMFTTPYGLRGALTPMTDRPV